MLFDKKQRQRQQALADGLQRAGGRVRATFFPQLIRFIPDCFGVSRTQTGYPRYGRLVVKHGEFLHISANLRKDERVIPAAPQPVDPSDQKRIPSMPSILKNRAVVVVFVRYSGCRYNFEQAESVHECLFDILRPRYPDYHVVDLRVEDADLLEHLNHEKIIIRVVCVQSFWGSMASALERQIWWPLEAFGCANLDIYGVGIDGFFGTAANYEPGNALERMGLAPKYHLICGDDHPLPEQEVLPTAMALKLFIPPCVYKPPPLHPPSFHKPLRIDIQGPLESIQKLLPNESWYPLSPFPQPAGRTLASLTHEALYGEFDLSSSKGDPPVRDEYLAWAMDGRRPLDYIDYYGVTFDHLVSPDDPNPEVLAISIIEVDNDEGAFANNHLSFSVDPTEYTGKKVLAVPRCCQNKKGSQDRRKINGEVAERYAKIERQRDIHLPL